MIRYALGWAVLLGAFGVGVALWVASAQPAVGAYLILLATFHGGEFSITALRRPAQLGPASFLFNVWLGYPVVIAATLVEYAVERAWWALPDAAPWALPVGGTLALGALGIRLWAMWVAGQAFDHEVQTELQPEHSLIDGGPYRWLRHPSYTGFYWFVAGTQIMLLNPVSLLVVVVMLTRFFSRRIVHEEAALVARFGDRYRRFRDSRRLAMPLVGARGLDPSER